MTFFLGLGIAGIVLLVLALVFDGVLEGLFDGAGVLDGLFDGLLSLPGERVCTVRALWRKRISRFLLLSSPRSSGCRPCSPN